MLLRHGIAEGEARSPNAAERTQNRLSSGLSNIHSQPSTFCHERDGKNPTRVAPHRRFVLTVEALLAWRGGNLKYDDDDSPPQ
jgi:hypothetical protein